ncbi:MAG: iron-containing redox enzyme family protein [Bacteroidota bacterium]
MKLNLFLSEWTKSYKQELEKVPMFNIDLTKNWSINQKKKFAKAFQHIRGHCAEFFWHVGSFSSSSSIKKIILNNIEEEFGYHKNQSKYSHSELYNLFMNEFGCDIFDEIGYHSTYLDFIRKFNQDHLKWLSMHNYDYKFATFSAYEKLDNLDYEKLYQLAKSLEPKNKESLIFFEVHFKVNHFENTSDVLIDIWEKNNLVVIESFDFIAKKQISIWSQLSDLIFSES